MENKKLEKEIDDLKKQIEEIKKKIDSPKEIKDLKQEKTEIISDLQPIERKDVSVNSQPEPWTNNELKNFLLACGFFFLLFTLSWCCR